MKFYVDTSIWIDLLEDRSDGIKPLGELAFQFLRLCRKNRAKLIYSEAIIFELNQFSEKLAEEIFSSFGNLLVEVAVSEEQTKEAKIIAKNRKLPPSDVLHAIIARDNGAIVVTRDKHFERLFDIAESSSPEEVTFY